MQSSSSKVPKGQISPAMAYSDTAVMVAIGSEVRNPGFLLKGIQQILLKSLLHRTSYEQFMHLRCFTEK